MKKIRFSFILVGVLLASMSSLTSCGNKSTNNGSKNLFVDLHTLMPTANETPTPDQPNPVNASRYIAKAYKEATGVTIHWASDYAKPTDTISNMRVWYNTQINVNNCPAIGYCLENGMQEDNVYVDLAEYLERPNPYVPRNEHWKDMFYDWVWEDPDVIDANGKIVGIPLVLDAGSATTVFYNKTMFSENNISVPKTWKDLVNVADQVKKISGVSYAYAPYQGDSTIGLDSWAVRYNIAPAFAKHMMDKVDYDGSGKVTTNELLRGVLEGKFDPNTCPEAKALYTQAYKYYNEFLPTGWQSINDWTTPWNEKKVAMKNQGLWYYTNEASNTLREFEFGMFAPPVLQSDTSVYASDLEQKTIAEGFESSVLMAFNIMKPAVENKPEVLESAIDFMMYLTSPDAMTAMVEEYGNGLSAVKIDSYPSVLDDAGWFDTKFTVINAIEWPVGFIAANTANINASFTNWVLGIGGTTQSEFFATLNKEQKAGAETMVKNMKIDTTGWNI